MNDLRAYASLLVHQIRTSLTLAFQYRADFMTEGLVEVFWMITAVVPLFTIYALRDQVAGWSFGEMLMVTGFFTLLQAVLEGAINPAMSLAVEQIRRGTFDFVLLKPKDPQFLVTTARFLPWRALNLLTAMGLFGYGFSRLGRAPHPADVAAAALLFCASVVILHSLWMVSVSLSFWVVKLDNLTYLFGAVFDVARWPSSVFRGAMRVVFTFVLPVAVMTTFPAEALLGRTAAPKLVVAAAVAIVTATVSRLIFRRAVRRYTSASS
jgi:ABC-2 type transport system permease protein